MDIINDLVDPAELTGFVREVPSPAQYVLNQILPDENIGDIEAEISSATITNRAAKFRAWDAETPIGKRDAIDIKRVALPPLGQKTVIGEYERIRLAAAQMGGDPTAALVARVYDDAEINTRAVLARAELARGDVLTDGKFTLTGENGLTLEADFGVDATHLVTADVSFDDADAADPIEELRGWVETYTADAGEPPAVAWTSSRVISALLRNDAIRALVSSVNGVPNLVSPNQLGQVLDAFGLPQLRAYDTRIDVDGTATRPIADDLIIFTPSDPRSLGITAWGVTAESLELVGGDNPSLEFEQAPGLVGVVMKGGDPVRRWTKVGGVVLPILRDVRKLLVATVITEGS